MYPLYEASTKATSLVHIKIWLLAPDDDDVPCVLDFSFVQISIIIQRISKEGLEGIKSEIDRAGFTSEFFNVKSNVEDRSPIYRSLQSSPTKIYISDYSKAYANHHGLFCYVYKLSVSSILPDTYYRIYTLDHIGWRQTDILRRVVKLLRDDLKTILILSVILLSFCITGCWNRWNPSQPAWFKGHFLERVPNPAQNEPLLTGVWCRDSREAINARASVTRPKVWLQQSGSDGDHQSS